MNPHDSLIPLLGRGPDPEQLRHVRTIPAREAEHEPWPAWVHPDLVAAYGSLGIQEPYRHQVEAAGIAHAGEHVVVATGTASGKSLAYQLPALDAIHRSELRVMAEPGKIHDDGAVTLYLSPTKALAADQLNAIRALQLPTVRAETYDGD
ncbi:MAG TPA: DEAD/DEAH box helicase, partial [Arthrobacter sp.]|nr:DEAD/DEAH box helicase [Arthrobacter sp.]